MPDMNLTNVKLLDQVSSHEIAGHENNGHKFDGHEIKEQDIISLENKLHYNACLLYTSPSPRD